MKLTKPEAEQAARLLEPVLEGYKKRIRPTPFNLAEADKVSAFLARLQAGPTDIDREETEYIRWLIIGRVKRIMFQNIFNPTEALKAEIEQLQALTEVITFTV